LSEYPSSFVLSNLKQYEKMDKESEKVVVREIEEKLSNPDLKKNLSTIGRHTGGVFIKNPKRKENK